VRGRRTSRARFERAELRWLAGGRCPRGWWSSPGSRCGASGDEPW